jgi:Fe-S cluster assembly protein SufD
VTLATLQQALRPGGAALPGSADSLRLREAARTAFAAAGLPTPRRETWRYTDLKSLADRAFELLPGAPDTGALRAVERVLAAQSLGPDAAHLVFVDGHPIEALGRLDDHQGIEIRDLQTRWQRLDSADRGTISTADHPLAALNTAYARAGAWLRVPDGVRILEPVHVVFIGSGAPDLAPQLRLVLELGRGAELTLVQHFIDAGEPSGWVNSVTEIDQAADSRLTLYRVQQHAPTHTHTALLAADLAARATASIGLVDLGGRLVRNDVDVKLRGLGASVELFGVFLAADGQHVDDHTLIDHIAPETRSDEAFRGIIGHRGRGVFNGKVVVHRGAQRIDARQSNDNLLLSDHAEIDAKPELEIYADDVKCSHGSTVGELDDEHLFYLRSRGIDEANARELLTVAFAATVLARIAVPHLREQITARVTARLRTLTEATP